MNGHYAIGDVVLGNWTLVKQLGQGSFGKVYEAHREDFGVTYKAAIKIITIPYDKSEIYSVQAEGMSEDSIIEYYCKIITEIVQEFALMSRLKGTANVVSYEDHAVVTHTDGIGWDVIIRMELLEPMLVYINAHQMTRRDIIRMGIDVCKALELCQKYNIIHRDIKPENMFVSELGDFKLGDFGIARTVEKTTGGLSKKGTYTYMAPEVYREEAYGSSVDIYSLGIVMYRLLNCNRTPFLPLPPSDISHNDRELALIRRISGEALPKPANAKGRLAEIVLKASSYNPKDRYSSPIQMRQELEAILYAQHEEQIIYGKANSIKLKAEDYASVKSKKREKHDSPKSKEDIAVISGEDTDRTRRVFEEHSHKRNTVEGRYQAKADSPKRKKSKRFVPVCLVALSLVVLLGAIGGVLYFKSSEAAYQEAIALMAGGSYQEAIDAFNDMGDYKDSAAKAVECVTMKAEADYQEAIALMESGNYQAAIDAFCAMENYKDSAVKVVECATVLKEEAAYQNAITLAENGEAAKAAIAFWKMGNYRDARERSLALWDNATRRNSISSRYYHTVGLKTDGTVVAVGANGYGQCNVSSWTDIAAVSTGYCHTVGLKSDGTVVAVGANGYGQCNVSSWTDIAAVSTGYHHTVGLKSDGTIVAVGSNGSGQCDVSDWMDIAAVSAGYRHTTGLKSDGTVVAVGSNGNGQCNISDWTDIVAVSAGYYHTVGLKSDGTVVAVGSNRNGQCNVSDWTDIVAVSAGYYHTVGLKSDGTVVAVGSNRNGQCNISDWTDIVAVSASYSLTVGLKADGTVIAVGNNSAKVSDWTDIKQPE